MVRPPRAPRRATDRVAERTGGAERDRTVDLLNAIQALSQLSCGCRHPNVSESRKLAENACRSTARVRSEKSASGPHQQDAHETKEDREKDASLERKNRNSLRNLRASDGHDQRALHDIAA